MLFTYSRRKEATKTANDYKKLVQQFVSAESSLYLNIPSRATVRAATYAELQAINKTDFIRAMMSYRETSQELQNYVFARVNTAYDEQRGTDKGRVIMNLLVSQAEEFRPIKMLKERLKQDKGGGFKMTQCYCGMSTRFTFESCDHGFLNG